MSRATLYAAAAAQLPRGGWITSPPAGIAAPSVGVPFLVDEFGPNARLAVEAAFGADITSGEPQMWNWYDVTAAVRYADGGRVSITPMGRADETAAAQPAGCSFQLDNTSGDYTPYLLTSKWSPNVKRSTPIRVRLTLDGITWFLRFQGYARGFQPGWDQSAHVATVDVAAEGITRRLGQGATPLKAPLTRAVGAGAATAFWPLDDKSDSTQAASGLSGGAPMTMTDGIAFGNYTNLGGLERAPDMGTGSLSGSVPGTHVAANTDHVFAFGVALNSAALAPADPLIDKPVVRINLGGYFYRLDMVLPDTSSHNMKLIAYYPDSTVGSGFVFPAPTDFDDMWHYYEWVVTFTAATGTLLVQHSRDGGALSAGAGLAAGAGKTLSSPISVDVNPNQLDFAGLGVAGVYVKVDAPSPIYAGAAADGYVGETTVERLTRLCSEENVPLAVVGTTTTTMGAQTPGTFVKLVREGETTEQGVLFDGLGPGLTFVTRSQRYNASAVLTVDASADPSELGYPFQPVDDDQRNVNAGKAERSGGSFALYQDDTGPLGTQAIGVYDTSVTVNTDTDGVLLDYAGWLVHLGTTEGFRYPSLKLDLRASPGIAAGWLACTVSSRIDVVNVSDVATQHPPDDVQLLLEGWSESLSPLDWDVAGNTSQYGPWQVGVLDSRGYLDCGASTLATDLTPTAVSVQLAIADTCTWVHTSGDFDIRIGRERMTVTAAAAASGSGSSWTQTLTVTRGVNGVFDVHSRGDSVHIHPDHAFVLAL